MFWYFQNFNPCSVCKTHLQSIKCVHNAPTIDVVSVQHTYNRSSVYTTHLQSTYYVYITPTIDVACVLSSRVLCCVVCAFTLIHTSFCVYNRQEQNEIFNPIFFFLLCTKPAEIGFDTFCISNRQKVNIEIFNWRSTCAVGHIYHEERVYDDDNENTL